MKTIRALAMAAAMSGCAGAFFPSAEPAVHYGLDYEPAAIPCSAGSPGAIRVWDFGAGEPYDQPAMVVLEEDGRVTTSEVYHWIAAPGTMISDSLIRDFDQRPESLWAVGSDDPVQAPLEISGRVLRFGQERSAERTVAVLEVVVSVVQVDPEPLVLLQRTYRYEATTADDGPPADFARAMGELVGRFSADLRSDLCEAAAGLPARSDEESKSQKVKN